MLVFPERPGLAGNRLSGNHIELRMKGSLTSDFLIEYVLAEDRNCSLSYLRLRVWDVKSRRGVEVDSCS